MPRRARISLPGVSVHLIQRGNNRSACFYADEDYLFYLDVLMEQAKKHGCAIHAWCLMTNQESNRGQTTFTGLGLWNSMEGGLYATSSTHITARRFSSSDSERE